MEVELALALDLAAEHGLYAYDAYLLTCALQHRAPLLTLDAALARTAMVAGIQMVPIDS